MDENPEKAEKRFGKGAVPRKRAGEGGFAQANGAYRRRRRCPRSRRHAPPAPRALSHDPRVRLEQV